MEERWQGLAIPQILHICLQETAPAPGSRLQGGCITWGTAPSTDEGGEREVRAPMGCRRGDALLSEPLPELTPHPGPGCSPADIRETAFVYAITAAGVSHAITQACSMGELLQCGCELTRSRAPPSPTVGPGMEGTAWEWGGCGDDVQFGYEKSQQFMDAKSKKGKNDIRALIDLHNNEAGRLVRPPRSLPLCKHYPPMPLPSSTLHLYLPRAMYLHQLWVKCGPSIFQGPPLQVLWKPPVPPPQHRPLGQGSTKRQGFGWGCWAGKWGTKG